MKVLAIALVAAAVFVGDAAAQRPRPSEVPPGEVTTLVAPNDFQVYNDFATPSRTFESRRAVVHYVVLGIDAPPLNDDDRDDVPDYVERVGSAADTAIDYYERRGFAAISADTGGPDARPDVYVSRFAPGSFGVAFPAADARGGAFVVVSNALDPSAESSLGSLYGTVAHELFHLVQFSYFSPTDEPSIPAWVLEGSAAAMEDRVFPELDDIVSSLQLRRWFAQPYRRLTAQSYGSQLFWRYVDEREPRLLPAYLERLAAPRPGNAAPALAATYARVAGRPFAPVFGRFASWVAGEFAGRVVPVRSLRVGARASGRVAPLAIHFVRLSHGARTVRVRRGELLYELRGESPGDASSTRRVAPRRVDGALEFTIPRGARVGSVTLVVANGETKRSVSYSISVD
jgi:hypothetical protein